MIRSKGHPIKKLTIHIVTLVLQGIYRLFSLLPQQNKIVCLSRQSNDAPIDFLLIEQELRRQNSKYKTVILARALDSKIAYCFHVFEQLYHIATAQAVLLDSYCIVVSLLAGHIKAPVIQMWHAMGNMKKFGYSAIGDEEGRSRSEAHLFKMHQGYDCVLVSSNDFIQDYAEGFGIDPSIIIEAPLPKTDLLIDPEYISKTRAQILANHPELKEKKNIVYCPTFRKSTPSNEHKAMASLISEINFEKYNLIYKKHPVSTQRIDDPRVLQYSADENMLYIADYVISDYSTVIYEAGLLKIPVYLYAYDWSEYREKRSLNIDLEHDVPTLFTDDAHLIIQSIEHDLFNRDAFQAFIKKNVAIPQQISCTHQIVSIIIGKVNRSKT